MSLLILSAKDVDTLISEFQPQELQLMMARLFCRFSTSQNRASDSEGSDETSISMPPRLHLSMLNHTALFMPARIGPAHLDLRSSPSAMPGNTSVKVVCVPKQSCRSDSGGGGLPATTMVLDEKTGSVKAIVNARKLTALRNAAGSALSTSLMLPTSSSTLHTKADTFLVCFGAGQQIEAHLDLHLRLFSITRCTIINRTLNDRVLSLHQKIISKFPSVAIQILTLSESDKSSVQSALGSAKIIICATPSTEPLFPASWVRTGTHIILIGSYKPEMKEVDQELILRSLAQYNDSGGGGTLLVDSREACMREAGELINAGIRPEQMKEIGEVLPMDARGDLDVSAFEELLATDRRPVGASTSGLGGNFDGPISIFKSVGIGIQDVAITVAVVQKALNQEGSEKIGKVIHDYDSDF